MIHINVFVVKLINVLKAGLNQCLLDLIIKVTWIGGENGIQGILNRRRFLGLTCNGHYLIWQLRILVLLGRDILMLLEEFLPTFF